MAYLSSQVMEGLPATTTGAAAVNPQRMTVVPIAPTANQNASHAVSSSDAASTQATSRSVSTACTGVNSATTHKASKGTLMNPRLFGDAYMAVPHHTHPSLMSSVNSEVEDIRRWNAEHAPGMDMACIFCMNPFGDTKLCRAERTEAVEIVAVPY